MKIEKSTAFTACIAIAAAALLAACGGGSSSDEQPAADDTQAPASITSSTAAWLQFASALAPVDVSNPLGLDAVTSVPQSETEEPQTL